MLASTEDRALHANSLVVYKLKVHFWAPLIFSLNISLPCFLFEDRQLMSSAVDLPLRMLPVLLNPNPGLR